MVKGWKSESARHSLARKGIETGKKKKIKTTKNTRLENDYLDAYHYDIWSITNEGVRETYKAKHPELSDDEILEMNENDMREELVELEEKKVAQRKVNAKEMEDYIESIKEIWGWRRGMEAP